MFSRDGTLHIIYGIDLYYYTSFGEHGVLVLAKTCGISTAELSYWN